MGDLIADAAPATERELVTRLRSALEEKGLTAELAERGPFDILVNSDKVRIGIQVKGQLRVPSATLSILHGRAGTDEVRPLLVALKGVDDEALDFSQRLSIDMVNAEGKSLEETVSNVLALVHGPG